MDQPRSISNHLTATRHHTHKADLSIKMMEATSPAQENEVYDLLRCVMKGKCILSHEQLTAGSDSSEGQMDMFHAWDPSVH